MRPFFRLFPLILFAQLALATSAATADPVQFNFSALAGSSSNFSFTLDSSPIPDTTATNYFAFNSIDVTSGGTTNSSIIFFYTLTDGGGLDGTALPFGLYGPQLFSGTTTAPTFLTGSFDLGNSAGAPLGTLTISAADGVPEPATWTLMLLGFGAVGFAMRRRKVTVTYT